MDREIRFRAYFQQYERMIYNIGIVNPNMILVDFSGNGNLESIFINDKIHLMQYTNATDTFGTEIYEGDILRWTLDDPSEDEIITGDYLVFWNNKELQWQTDYIQIKNNNESLHEFLRTGGFEEVKVIGNLHENPGLMN